MYAGGSLGKWVDRFFAVWGVVLAVLIIYVIFRVIETFK